MEITNINDIASFVWAVKCGSYSGAAKQLGLTRSAIGKSIIRLEERLSIRLLNRTTRSLSLTDEGRLLFARCVSLLDDLEDIENMLAQRTESPRGRLRINLPLALGRLHVLPVIEAYLQRWPELSIDVSFSDNFVDLIEEGYDIAVRVGHPREDSRLLTRNVAVQRMITCASPAYLARRGTPLSPKDLTDHDCIHFLSEGKPRPWSLNTEVSGASPAIIGRLQMDSAEALLSTAIAGLGVVTLPDYLVWQDIQSGKLIVVLEAFAETPAPIRVVYPSKKHLSPKIRQFIDLLVESWSPRAPWEVESP